jgi:hypothetical protein
MDASEKPHFPWSDKSPIRGNLAIGNLRVNIKARLTTPHGVHLETLLTASGAVAGYAAQNALWAVSGLTPAIIPISKPGQSLANSDFAAVRLRSGDLFYFGDRLNAYLTGGRTAPDRFFLWGFVRGALSQLGDASTLPDIGTMYSNVSKSIRTGRFGFPTVPERHLPHISAERFIKVAWPFVRRIFVLPSPKGIVDGEPLIEERHWPIVASVVAGQFMLTTKGHIEPLVGATLVMEAAIAASKIDPRTVARC